MAYNPDSYLVTRFRVLAWEGIRPTPTVAHSSNIVEKIGNGLLYIPENLPRVIKNVATNPQAITITIFAALHFANCMAFYPTQTTEILKTAVTYFPEITGEVVKMAGWLTTSSLITGYCARAGGRLTEAYITALQVPRHG